MTEIKKWENSEIVALLRSELQYVEELTDTGKLDDVVDEIERRLDLKAERFQRRCQKYEELLNDFEEFCQDDSFMWNRIINKNITKIREEISKI